MADRVHDVFELAGQIEDGDHLSLFGSDVDLDVSLSRETARQPFHFAIDHDSLLVQLAGEAEVTFDHPDVRRVRVVPGDIVYVPAGLDHQVVPRTPSLQLRYCGSEPHAERASVRCPACGHPIAMVVWNSGAKDRRDGLAAARQAHARICGQTCPNCGFGDAAPSGSDQAPDSVVGPGDGDGCHFPVADPESVPLHASALWIGHLMTSQSAPLFPRLGRGAIVPCVGMTYGSDRPFGGHFHHRNSVDEVILVLGANGVPARPGTVRVLEREHEVRPAMPDPFDPDSYVMTLIVQRQSAGAGQAEDFWLTCDDCGATLLERSVEVDPSATTPLPGFDTLLLAAATVREFNRDPGLRRCKRCGRENPPFDVEGTGWERYAARLRTANAVGSALGVAPLTG